MKEHIDKIIKSSETEKSLSLRPELWQKLERQLDNADSLEASFPKRKMVKRHKIVGSKWIAAASLALFFTVISTFYLQLHSYQIEDLITSSEPYFTKEDLRGLEAFYNQPDRVILNKKPV